MRFFSLFAENGTMFLQKVIFNTSLLRCRGVKLEHDKPTSISPGHRDMYSRLPITRTLANLKLALTRTKIDFPWISVILSL